MMTLLRRVRTDIADPDVETWFLWPSLFGMFFAVTVLPAWCVLCLLEMSK